MSIANHRTALSTQGLPAELLLDYATGAAAEPVALAVATYLSMNPSAMRDYAALNRLGGTLLNSIAPATLANNSLSNILDRIDSEPVAAPVPATDSLDSCPVPLPLRSYIGLNWDKLAWKSVTTGVEEYVIASQVHSWRTSLLRIAPGKALPAHTHVGEEYTIVLDGAYSDENGSFVRGNIEIADQTTTHRPVSDPVTGCVCLAVLSAPLHLTGVLGWFLNPFIQH
jgi:putative transcriptional regulator